MAGNDRRTENAEMKFVPSTGASLGLDAILMEYQARSPRAKRRPAVSRLR
jgi:hypothetical protein